MRTKIDVAVPSLALVAMLLVGGCQTAPKTEEGKADLEQESQSAVNRMRNADTGIDKALKEAYGHVIFPKAGKGGFIVGGGYGRGVAYEQGRQVGFADITQLSAGLQIGGQAFSELIIFQNKEALDRFKNNQLTFSANASGVIVKKGVATAVNYDNGVAVFVLPVAGAMAEASIGGQKFTFTPMGGSGQPATRPAERASAKEGPTETQTQTQTQTETRIEQRQNAD